MSKNCTALSDIYITVVLEYIHCCNFAFVASELCNLFIMFNVFARPESNCVILCFSAMPDRYYYRVARVGQTVKFPCETILKENVHWKRTDTLDYIYVTGSMRPGVPSRISVDKNTSNTLTIANVTDEDTAVYGCFEDDGHGNRRYYGLTVTG